MRRTGAAGTAQMVCHACDLAVFANHPASAGTVACIGTIPHTMCVGFKRTAIIQA